jgi:hypothetical protein
LSSASSDAIQALAVAKAATKEDERESDKWEKKKLGRKVMTGHQDCTFGSFRNL